MNQSLSIQLRQFKSDHQDDPAVHFIAGGDNPADEYSPAAQAEPKQGAAEVVEGDGSFRDLRVTSSGSSGFTHFLDGIQMSRRFMFYKWVPIVWGYSAACIRKRGYDRRMGLEPGMYDSQEAVYLPSLFVDAQEFSRYGISVVDITCGAPGEKVNQNPEALRVLAHEALSRSRDKMEENLHERWVRDLGERGRLLVDGSMAGFSDIADGGRVVGIVKSHNTWYFQGEDHRRVLSLPEGHRTSVFKPRLERDRRIHSWYLRLRSNVGRDLTFGLIRVDVREGFHSVEMADEISGWILAERCPVSLPDGRWDRMIYPIHDCEQYLRSLAPSKIYQEAAL